MTVDHEFLEEVVQKDLGFNSTGGMNEVIDAFSTIVINQ